MVELDLVKPLELANNILKCLHVYGGSGEERVLCGCEEAGVVPGEFGEQESVGAKQVQMMRWLQPFFPLGTPVARC